MKVGRRGFLLGSMAATAGSVGCRPRGASTANVARPGDESIPALVVGSGFGGGVAALRLAQAGIRTLVLERGRRWPIVPSYDTFATRDALDGRAFWMGATIQEPVSARIPRYAGVLEVLHQRGLRVLNGAGVGGGSLVYINMTITPTRENFYRTFSRDLDYDELASIYYPRAQAMLQASPIPEDILATDYYAATRAFIDQARRAGLPHRLMDLTIDWSAVREELNGTRRASLIVGEAMHGTNSGAKRSVDRTYLARAEETRRVAILPLHRVAAISEVPGHGFRVACDEINDVGEVLRQKTFVCRYLFLAAGSVGTSFLLAKAKSERTLDRLSDDVGLFWGTNGDHFMTRHTDAGTTNPSMGAPAGCRIDFFDTPFGPSCLESIVAPLGAPQGTIHTMGVGIPGKLGRVRYEPGSSGPVIDWSHDDPANRPMLDAIRYMHGVLDERLALPPASTRLSPPTAMTGHPLGGAVLGRVCDFDGRVRGYDGLFVVDGALVPGSCGVANPSFTITALAERCMARVVPTLRLS